MCRRVIVVTSVTGVQDKTSVLCVNDIITALDPITSLTSYCDLSLNVRNEFDTFRSSNTYDFLKYYFLSTYITIHIFITNCIYIIKKKKTSVSYADVKSMATMTRAINFAFIENLLTSNCCPISVLTPSNRKINNFQMHVVCKHYLNLLIFMVFNITFK